MPADLPEISHLQYLALGVLRAGERPGRELREVARRFGVRRTRAAFYQFMARLEGAGLVEGRYEQVDLNGQVVTERRYGITPEGRRAWADARAFFDAVDLLADPTAHA